MLRMVLLVSLALLVQGCSTVVSTTTGGTGVKEDPGQRSVGTMIDDSSIETTVDVNIDAADPALRPEEPRYTSSYFINSRQNRPQ